MKKWTKIQGKILKRVWKSGNKGVFTTEIARDLGLTQKQVYDAVRQLGEGRRELIKREPLISGGGWKNPPRKRIKITPNYKRERKIKEVIKND